MMYKNVGKSVSLLVFFLLQVIKVYYLAMKSHHKHSHTTMISWWEWWSCSEYQIHLDSLPHTELSPHGYFFPVKKRWLIYAQLGLSDERHVTTFRTPRGGNAPRRKEIWFFVVVWIDDEKTSYLVYSTAPTYSKLRAIFEPTLPQPDAWWCFLAQVPFEILA